MIIAPLDSYQRIRLAAAVVFLSQVIVPSYMQDVTLGLLVPFNVNSTHADSHIVSGQYYAAAISLAVEAINNDVKLLPKLQLGFVWNDTSCQEEQMLQAISEQWSKKVHAFIGPGCFCSAAAKLATAWDLPVISYMCQDDSLSDKKTYPTFARTISLPGMSVLRVLEHFNWTWIGLITEESPDWRERGSNIQRILTDSNVTVRLQRFVPSRTDYTANKTGPYFKKVLQDMQEVCRVFILAMDYSLAREAMFYAGQLGMNDGRFAFIAFALDLNTVRINIKTPNHWFTGHYGPETEALTSRETFESVILLATRTVDGVEYTNFTDRLKLKTSESPFYSDVYNSHSSKLEPPVYASLLYDAVYLYATALNATLESGGSVTDGRKIANHIFNRRYHSILGYERFITAAGDAELDLVMMDYRNASNGTFEEVGNFHVNEQGNYELTFLGNRSVWWPHNKAAPVGIPACGFYNDKCVKRNFTLGLLLPYKNAVATGNNFNAGKWYASAIVIALDKVNNDPNFLPDVHIDFIWSDTNCEEEVALREMTEQFQKKVDGFIGFGCTCATQARFGAAWNMPIISYMCTDDKVSDKKLYPTFARTIFGDRNLGPSVLALMTHFRWNRVGIISEEKEAWRRRGNFLEKFLTENDKTVALHEHVPFYLIYDRNIKEYGEEYRKTMEKMKKSVRIIIFVTHRRLVREGMYYASKLGMNNGDYAFFMFELDPMKVERNQKMPLRWFRGNYNETTGLTPSENQELMKAYQNALYLVSSRSEFGEYDEFLYKMKKAMSKAPFFSMVYEIKFVDGNITKSTFNLTPPALAGFLYDAAHLYAIAVNRTLAGGGNPSNGKELMANIFGRKFPSVLGYDLLLDQNGDVVYNLTLLDLRRSSDGSSYNFVPVGKFELEESNNYTQLFVQNENSTFVWIKGEPPVDVPKCGFNNEHCQDDSYTLGTMEIVSICLASVLVLMLFVGAVVYRKQKLERELASNAWKVNYNEISLRTRQPGSLRSQISVVTSDTIDNIGQRQLFTTVGTYRSNIIALKKVNKRAIELSREIKVELKQMRDVRHDNLAPFIGACVDPPNICILFQYCPKGSLQDILENEDVKLDSMFVSSLITDIVKGMSYLHSTEIKSHGNLKSSNCVVDGRWVLKITDYGLNKFKGNQEKWDEGEYSKYYSKVWCAPELLRMDTAPSRGTQRGDVYSFSIILQELLTRSGPFDMCIYETEPKEVIQRVKRLESPPFRPTLTNIVESSDLPGLRQLAEKCWNEVPELRPDFDEIKRHVRKVSTGKHASIMDNMVNMLEKYANNLESLVEERTSQLAEEKRKTLNLLHRMLPPTVARDLINGKQVVPENFDEVSIFFSDIVGFTSLSSQSTPIQVVDMLNDLYTLFDGIISYYDVYKVETIGDAYMVVSGLPIQNNHQHAGEIAKMALHMSREIAHFKIRHRPGQQLQLRIGIHSGPVVAGVVGNTMPRYCLFGDTVNTASRMESNGEALKIHISSNTKVILDTLGGYHVTERGEVFLKGKGMWITYWLQGCDYPLRKNTYSVTKTKSQHTITYKRKESSWKIVKDLLPKLKNGHLPPAKAPPSPKAEIMLTPVTS